MFAPHFTKTKLEDLTDLNDLVAEVARVDAHAGQTKAELEAATAELKKDITEKTTVELPAATAKGKPRTLTLAEYREELVKRAEDYAKAHPEAAAADGKKSRQYAAGVIQWRKEPDRVEIVDRDKFDKATQTIGKKILGFLSGLVIWKTQEKATAAKIVKAVKLTDKGPTVEVDPTAIQKGIKAKEWTPAVLGMVGMKLVEGQDRLTIKTTGRQPE